MTTQVALLMSEHAKRLRVELAGVYAVASKLCQKGYLAIPVPIGRYPDIDIVVHDLKAGRFTGIQVKTLEKKHRWYFSPSKIHPTVFVTLEPEPQFYVHDLSSVSKIVQDMEKLQPKGVWVSSTIVEDPAKLDKWDNIW